MRITLPNRNRITVLLAAGLALLNARAQYSYTTLGSPYTQDFNSLGTSATAALPTGWRMNNVAGNLDTDWALLGTTTTLAYGTTGTGVVTGTSTGGAINWANGITGSANWRKGNWQGYQKADLDAEIDMESNQLISQVNANFLQDVGAWIVAPRQFIVEVSTDGKQFTRVYSGENFLPIEDRKVQVRNVEAKFSPVTARYVRIKAIQYGKLPAWHEGAGGDTHLFIDEIEIR